MLFVLINANTFAQWQWAASGTMANSWDQGNGVTADASGNAYVIGSFTSSTLQLGTFVLTNHGISTDDIYIVKYSSAGNPLWVHSAGGSNQDYGMAITTDASGNVYATGHYYSDTIIFGNDTLLNTTSGVTDIYTVKYSSAGNELWARTGGGAGFDETTTITTDASGNVYIAGQYYSANMAFGAQTVTNTGADTLDMFIVKYDSLGNVLWARSAGGNSNDAIADIATDRAGNVLITGTSGSPICNFGTVTLTNPGIFGYDNVFTVKYDSSGNAIWGATGEGYLFEQGTGVATDTTNNVYITGSFASSYTTFGNDTLFNVHAGGGTSDIFIVKYNSAGTLLWAKRAGGNYIDVSNGIAADASGNAFITGYFEDTTITFGTTVLTTIGGRDVFVAEYNSSGNAIAAYSAGGTGYDRHHRVRKFGCGSAKT